MNMFSSVGIFNYETSFSAPIWLTVSVVLLLLFVTVLIWFYNRIPKSTDRGNPFELKNPIYQYKDMLLQEKNSDSLTLFADKTTSVWVKIFIYILIVLIATTPLFELLNLNYFL